MTSKHGTLLSSSCATLLKTAVMHKLREYQATAADFLYENNSAMVLAWVGAGKTACALTAMRDMIHDGHTKRWLVLAPKRVATEVWPGEAKKWAPGLSISVAVGTKRQRDTAFAELSQVVVANYGHHPDNDRGANCGF